MISVSLSACLYIIIMSVCLSAFCPAIGALKSDSLYVDDDISI